MLANVYSTPQDSNPQPVSSQSKFEPRFYARVIRSIQLPERQPCRICSKYKHICHAHHIIPVNQMSKLLALVEFPVTALQKLSVPIAWLCPNHHAMIHFWDRETTSDSAATDLLIELTQAEHQSISNYLTNVVANAWSEFHAFIEEHGTHE